MSNDFDQCFNNQFGDRPNRTRDQSKKNSGDEMKRKPACSLDTLEYSIECH